MKNLKFLKFPVGGSWSQEFRIETQKPPLIWREFLGVVLTINLGTFLIFLTENHPPSEVTAQNIKP